MTVDAILNMCPNESASALASMTQRGNQCAENCSSETTKITAFVERYGVAITGLVGNASLKGISGDAELRELLYITYDKYTTLSEMFSKIQADTQQCLNDLTEFRDSKKVAPLTAEALSQLEKISKPLHEVVTQRFNEHQELLLETKNSKTTLQNAIADLTPQLRILTVHQSNTLKIIQKLDSGESPFNMTLGKAAAVAGIRNQYGHAIVSGGHTAVVAIGDMASSAFSLLRGASTNKTEATDQLPTAYDTARGHRSDKLPQLFPYIRDQIMRTFPTYGNEEEHVTTTTTATTTPPPSFATPKPAVVESTVPAQVIVVNQQTEQPSTPPSSTKKKQAKFLSTEEFLAANS